MTGPGDFVIRFGTTHDRQAVRLDDNRGRAFLRPLPADHWAQPAGVRHAGKLAGGDLSQERPVPGDDAGHTRFQAHGRRLRLGGATDRQQALPGHRGAARARADLRCRGSDQPVDSGGRVHPEDGPVRRLRRPAHHLRERERDAQGPGQPPRAQLRAARRAEREDDALHVVRRHLAALRRRRVPEPGPTQRTPSCKRRCKNQRLVAHRHRISLIGDDANQAGTQPGYDYVGVLDGSPSAPERLRGAGGGNGARRLLHRHLRRANRGVDAVAVHGAFTAGSHGSRRARRRPSASSTSATRSTCQQSTPTLATQLRWWADLRRGLPLHTMATQPLLDAPATLSDPTSSWPFSQGVSSDGTSTNGTTRPTSRRRTR